MQLKQYSIICDYELVTVLCALLMIDYEHLCCTVRVTMTRLAYIEWRKCVQLFPFSKSKMRKSDERCDSIADTYIFDHH
jgi:hypothetical protein